MSSAETTDERVASAVVVKNVAGHTTKNGMLNTPDIISNISLTIPTMRGSGAKPTRNIDAYISVRGTADIPNIIAIGSGHGAKHIASFIGIGRELLNTNDEHKS